MRPIQRVIHAGFATAAIASAAVPAFAWTAWPDVDFGWHANAGRVAAARQPAQARVARGNDTREAGSWLAPRTSTR
ncbi:MAG TPA: hypothetical protein VLS49_03710 [Usitatibacter sp.]|nr:hypothetical protein [Usitatibacter sp.]